MMDNYPNLFKFLKTFVFLISISLLLVNCQKDEQEFSSPNETTEHSTLAPFTISKINSNEINSNEKIVSKLLEFSNTSSFANKNLYNPDFDFYIDTETAIYMEGENGHSYTFPIYRDSISNKTENLLLVHQENETYNAFLISYYFNDQQKTQAQNNEDILGDYQVDIQPLDDYTYGEVFGKIIYSGDCIINETIYHTNPQGTWILGNGNTCPHPAGYCDVTIVITILTCNNTGGGGNSSGLPGNSSPTPGNNGGGGNNGSGTTTPYVPAPERVRKKNFEMQLTPDQKLNLLNIFQNNTSIYDDMFEYLEEDFSPGEFIGIGDNYNIKAMDFAEEVIDNVPNGGWPDFINIIMNNLTGKADCIYQRLIYNSSGFKAAIQQFDGEFPVSHLSLNINNTLPSGNYGITKPPENYNITIEMSNSQLNNISDLGAALALIHELIHAEIFRKMLSAAQTGDLDPQNMTAEQQVIYVNSLRNNFPGIYDYYIDRYHPTWNHNMMAQHYLDVIADMLEEFDNFSKPRTVYDDIAWAGLRVLEDLNNSIAWDNLTQNDRNRILLNFQQYFFNGSNSCN